MAMTLARLAALCVPLPKRKNKTLLAFEFLYHCKLSVLMQVLHTPAAAPPHPDLKYPLIGHAWHI